MKKKFASAFIFLSLSTFAQSPWIDQATGFGTPSRGVNSIDIVTADTVWVTAYDGTNTLNYITDYSKTINGGTNWSPGNINTGIAGVGIGNISAINSSTAWACIYHPTQAFAGGIWKTTDGGFSWTQQTTAAFSIPSFPDFVYFWDANNGIAAGDPLGGYFEVYTTTDGGTTWTRTANTGNQLSSGTAEYGYTNGFSVVGGTLWMSTTLGKVFKTTDKGFTFTSSTVGNGITDVQRISFSDLNLGYAAKHNTGNLSYKMAITTDGGTTWSALPVSKLILGADVCAIPGTNSLIAVGSDTTRSGSAISIDNGANWTLMEDTLLKIQRLSVKFLDNITGWAGGFNTGIGAGGISKYVGPSIGFPNYSFDKKNISLFPNPASDFLTINMNGLNGKQLTIEIFNLVGEKISEENMSTDSPVCFKYIDLKNIPNGIYFVIVKDGQNKFVDKFVKQ